MKHTSGPWKKEFDETGGYDCMTAAWHIKTADERIICDIDLRHFGEPPCSDGPPCPEAEANARLIAAAPELLEALEDALSDLRWVEQHIHDSNFRASILKGEHIIQKAGGNATV